MSSSPGSFFAGKQPQRRMGNVSHWLKKASPGSTRAGALWHGLLPDPGTLRGIGPTALKVTVLHGQNSGNIQTEAFCTNS